MNITPEQLAQQVALARTRGWAPFIAGAEKRHKLPAGLLLAIASRETNMQDTVGDQGHGRGLFQIDDRFHGDWLVQHGAPGANTTPRIKDAAEFAAATLASNAAFAQQNGVRSDLIVKFAASAYNAGQGGALSGFRGGDSDLRTAHGDYGADVIGRLAAIQGNGGGGQTGGILEQGSRGPAVVKLKRALQAWYNRNAPGAWAAFRVVPGPGFGAAVAACVKDFQLRNGLTVDGQVGQQTLTAIEHAGPPPKPSPQPNIPPGYPDLQLGTPKKQGATGEAVKLIQGWLCLHNFKVVVDGGYGKATAAQVSAFQKASGLRPTGVVDAPTWTALIRPMLVALAPIQGKRPLGQLVVAYARQHLAQHPLEVGGENSGPWVRLYTQGLEGTDYPWCAAFATFCLTQACKTLGVAMPVPGTLSCDDMARHAGGRLLPQPGPSQRSRITPGSFFLRLAGPGENWKYAHTGIVVQAGPDTLSTIEGNTNDSGSAEGYEVCARTRAYPGLDFIVV